MGAGGQDAFTVLGSVEVDQAKLDKSLRETERKLEASAKKGADFFTKGVEGGEGGPLSFGKLLGQAETPGGEGKPQLFQEVSREARFAGREMSHAARVMREMIAGPLAALDPSLAKVAGGMSAAARGARFYGLSVGLMVVASVAASEALSKLLEKAEELSKSEFELAQAIKYQDIERAAGSYKKAREELDRYNFTVKESTKEIGGFMDGLQVVVAFWKTMLTDENRLKEALEASAKAWRSLYISVQIPKNEIENRKRFYEQEKQFAEVQAKEADSIEDVTKAYERMRVAQEFAEKNLEKEIELKYKKLATDNQVEEVTDKQLASLKEESEAAVEEVKKFQSAINNRSLAGSAMDSLKQLGLVDGQTLEEARDAAQKLSNEANKAYAKAIEDKKIFTAMTKEKDKEVEISRRSNRLALDKINKEELAAGAELIKRKEEQYRALGELDRKRADDADKAAIALAKNAHEQMLAQQDRVAAFISSEPMIRAEYKATIAELDRGKQASEEAYASSKRELDAQIAVGGAAASKARAELEKLDKKFAGEQAANDEKRLLARGELNKKLAAEREKEWQYAIDQAERYYKFVDQMGTDTSREQIALQEQVARSAETGSRRWYDAMSKIYELYQKIRDTAKQNLDFIMQTGAEELKKQGITEGTLKDLEDATKARQKADQELIARGKRGGQVNFEEYGAALKRQQGFEALGKEEGGVADILTKAITPVFEKMQESVQVGAQASDRFMDSANVFAAAVAQFAQAAGEIGRSKDEPVGGGDSAYWSAKLGRMQLMENRRGVEAGIITGQETAS